MTHSPSPRAAPPSTQQKAATSSDAERLAVALQYAWGQAEATPLVVARGRGVVADRIVQTAVENNVPVRSDADLAKTLGRIDVGLPIPPEAFLAVAQVLAFLYRLDGTLQQRHAIDAAEGRGR